MRIVLLLCLALGIAVPAHAACDAPTAASGRVAITVGTIPRSFVLRVPSDASGPAPVVFVFHPYGMNAAYMQARAPIARLWPGAVVVYPEGSGFPQTWQTRPLDRADRDVHFFDAMRAWLHEHGCIDDGRVFVMGYSNGAALAYTLVCERATVIAGAAIVSGRLGCVPKQPMPIIVRHGTHDDTVFYRAALSATTAFATANRCTAPPKPGVQGCVEAEACASGGVVLCTDDGGHEYNFAFTAEAVDFLRRVAGGPEGPPLHDAPRARP
jgi:poly(3-hydroxybutyrate) depolymerase